MGEEAELTFETWRAGLSETDRALLDGSTRGLTTALEKERGGREAEQAELDRLTDLADLQGRLRRAQLRESVFEGAGRGGCVNPKAALALVTEQGLTLGDAAEVDWRKLRELAPELFQPAYRGSADGGAGLRQSLRPSVGDLMNRIIRDATGR